jgi:hypothetical protein
VINLIYSSCRNFTEEYACITKLEVDGQTSTAKRQFPSLARAKLVGDPYYFDDDNEILEFDFEEAERQSEGYRKEMKREDKDEDKDDEEEEDEEEQDDEEERYIRLIVAYNGSSWRKSGHWIVLSFFEELMKFIGCVPSHWTPTQFLSHVLGT